MAEWGGASKDCLFDEWGAAVSGTFGHTQRCNRRPSSNLRTFHFHIKSETIVVIGVEIPLFVNVIRFGHSHRDDEYYATHCYAAPGLVYASFWILWTTNFWNRPLPIRFSKFNLGEWVSEKLFVGVGLYLHGADCLQKKMNRAFAARSLWWQLCCLSWAAANVTSEEMTTIGIE